MHDGRKCKCGRKATFYGDKFGYHRLCDKCLTSYFEKKRRIKKIYETFLSYDNEQEI